MYLVPTLLCPKRNQLEHSRSPGYRPPHFLRPPPINKKKGVRVMSNGLGEEEETTPKEGRPSKDKQKLGRWNVPCCGRYPLSPPLLSQLSFEFSVGKTNLLRLQVPSPLSLRSFASASCIVRGEDWGAPF
ncbi:hypothetical protein CEXT_612151 [Caerostris extrusa]|uniref:Uncharacterized protein n=1 Tax=Caerostris extrusa TaxID=172846 RepID=A0AAV4MSX8_CAEEX|nr:hypothetical protein CEXT_612151 [Caerostris extrusa]